ncbi:hypothetical protein GCM10017674_60440 [Streptomyces gardneri]|uniref:Uncharacterized protein n=1 Tax=Streptomyces gardneri TaxID=66892 RepID=A0A4Y3RIR4_9ACTN|nr:hypothetical protein SGA01_28790 [Streptomyces gardneri]GHH13315.1 hypothetical protein GCM10017674_60440 [Streptomyces gardneri]
MTLRHAAKPFTAAHVHFALDIVESINPVPEHRHMAPGYPIQTALTEEELGGGPPFPPATACRPPRGFKVPPGLTRPRRNLLGHRAKAPLDCRIP